MKIHRWIAFSGVLTITLLLSGCMAAMMPAMMLGHAAHKKDSGVHGQTTKSCECAKPGAPTATAATAPDAATTSNDAPSTAASHKH
jgi:hypothetical protein